MLASLLGTGWPASPAVVTHLCSVDTLTSVDPSFLLCNEIVYREIQYPFQLKHASRLIYCIATSLLSRGSEIPVLMSEATPGLG